MESREAMDRKWSKIDKRLEAKEELAYKVPEVPFQNTTLIRDFNGLYAKIYDKEKFIQAWSLKISIGKTPAQICDHRKS